MTDTDFTHALRKEVFANDEMIKTYGVQTLADDILLLY